MTDNPALDYNRLVIEANRLGRRMKLLHEAVSSDMEIALGREYTGELSDLNELHQTLWGIGAVLSLLRGTPNAYINPEGMASIRNEVESTAKIERLDWAKAILDEVDPPVW